MSSEKRKREDEEAEPNRAESQSLAPCLSLIEIDGNQSSNSKTTIDNFNFHLKSVYAVIYINELEIIATSSYDKTIEIWKKKFVIILFSLFFHSYFFFKKKQFERKRLETNTNFNWTYMGSFLLGLFINISNRSAYFQWIWRS